MYFTQITAPLTNSALPCFISQRAGVARRAGACVRLASAVSPGKCRRHRSAPLAVPTLAARRLSDGGRVCERVQRVKRLGAVSEGQPALHYAA